MSSDTDTPREDEASPEAETRQAIEPEGAIESEGASEPEGAGQESSGEGDGTGEQGPGVAVGEASPEGEAAEEVPVEIDPQVLRLLEAVLFTATEPMTETAIADRLPDGVSVHAALRRLQEVCAGRGVSVAMAGGRWFMRTAEDLSEQLRVHMTVPRRLSRAAMETLAIIAYHQPVTRAEIEEIRGVGLSKGTLDQLFESGWIGPKGRRRTAGRPVTWGTMPAFLTTFGLETIRDLPGLDDLKAAGLLDKRPAIQITDVQGDQVDSDEGEGDEEDEFLDMDLPEDGPEVGGAEDALPGDVGDTADDEPTEDSDGRPGS